MREFDASRSNKSLCSLLSKEIGLRVFLARDAVMTSSLEIQRKSDRLEITVFPSVTPLWGGYIASAPLPRTALAMY